MWVYNETGELIDNDLVEEIEVDGKIDKILIEVQSMYDGLFENNSTNFEFIGFRNEVDRAMFFEKIGNVINLIKEEIGGKYIIENEVAI
jgi:hypothetical protein